MTPCEGDDAADDLREALIPRPSACGRWEANNAARGLPAAAMNVPIAHTECYCGGVCVPLMAKEGGWFAGAGVEALSGVEVARSLTTDDIAGNCEGVALQELSQMH